MKKLLFLGIDTSTQDAFAYAKAKGIYTIITDYLDMTSSPLKAEADECWQINVTDLDTLEQRCRDNHVSGIFAGTHELCLECCKELCARLGLPFYASEQGWAAARDKELYKRCCREAGLDVPRQYWIGGFPPQEVFDEVQFPVVVKPNDGSAKRGFSVARSREELRPAIERALTFSDQDKIIVEDFIEGNLVTVICCIRSGRLDMIDILIDLSNEKDQENSFRFFIHESRYSADIRERLVPLYEKIIRDMNCREGAIFFQSILRDQTYYQLEMGYRLDGTGSWKYIERLTGFNQLKYMVDLALGEKPEDKYAERYGDSGNGSCAKVFIWGMPGQICSIEGKTELYSRADVLVQWDRFREGDTIPDTGDMRAIALILEIFGTFRYEISEKLREITRVVRYCDKDGKDLLVCHDDLFEKWQAFQPEADG